jgi:hypothetical protein
MNKLLYIKSYKVKCFNMVDFGGICLNRREILFDGTSVAERIKMFQIKWPLTTFTYNYIFKSSSVYTMYIVGKYIIYL